MLPYTHKHVQYVHPHTVLPNQVRLRATLLKVTKGGKWTPRVDL